MVVLALSSCGGNDPIADENIVIPEDVVGDASATGLAAPANAAAAEAHVDAHTPPATDGQRWHDQSSGGRLKLSYGPGGGQSALVLACEPGDSSTTIAVVRGSPAPRNGMATMSFTGGGHIASLPMHDMDGGNGARLWSGSVTGDDAIAVGRTFERPGAVEISLGGAPSLVVPSTPELRNLFARCAK
ncbi:hypothetical protein H9L12_09840 [Sphingomonas rhizophila]|uniref:Uncharacterized protein n=1 Tax=Sphingomonas rhizophila TaxID=2071607 RepID=A0A7G9S9R8_9SPHN|nr:hypothetical protein [Sphingomonas rhizophila]QNN64593.1 hypothetical protein H9L12_09840 [Sphingomonas rhizophila]